MTGAVTVWMLMYLLGVGIILYMAWWWERGVSTEENTDG